MAESAANAAATPESAKVTAVASEVSETAKAASSVADSQVSTPSMVVDKKPASTSDALKQQADDATSEKNLEEVFTSNE